MTEKTIETFVSKLQSEGVEAGKEKARRITEDAETKAAQIVSEAQKEAEHLVQAGEKKAEETVDRARTEMALACRDTLAKLRETLTIAMNNIVAAETQKALEDTDFLKDAIRDIVKQYAEADTIGASGIEITVSEEIRRTLESWILDELGKSISGSDGTPSINLKDGLAAAGFEYTISEGTVEVTVDSVAETISEMVSPAVVSALENTGEES